MDVRILGSIFEGLGYAVVHLRCNQLRKPALVLRLLPLPRL